MKRNQIPRRRDRVFDIDKFGRLRKLPNSKFWEYESGYRYDEVQRAQYQGEKQPGFKSTGWLIQPLGE